MFGEVIKAVSSGGPVSLPCTMYEPLSVLQRTVEMFEFRTCLDKAVEYKDPLNRIAFIAAFATSSLAYTTGRFKTNFNPILGETFEFIDTRSDPVVNVFAEQISHHPPLTALFAEGKKWKLFLNSNAGETKTSGSGMILETKARTYIQFFDSDQKYSVSTPSTKIHNLLLGSPWIEHFGELEVKNLTTGDHAVLKYKQAGLFEGVQKKIGGFVFNKEGKKCIKLSGDWTSSLKGHWGVDTADIKNKEAVTLWQTEEKEFPGPYKLSEFSTTLTVFDESALPTDSRRRPDSRHLLAGETTKATAWKRVAENKQRAEEKTRNEAWAAKSGKSKPDTDVEAGWAPVWFVRGKDHNGHEFWNFNAENPYWKQRDQCLKDSKNPVEQLKAKHVNGTAADFSDYVKYQDVFDKEFKDLDGKADEGSAKVLLVVPSDAKETKSCEEGHPHEHDIAAVKSVEEKGNHRHHVKRDKKGSSKKGHKKEAGEGH